MCQGPGVSFQLDRDGGAEVLKEIVAETLMQIGLQVAEAADNGAKVAEFSTVEDYVTDRYVVAVTVPAERQAKFGVLTKAAAAAGLEVRSK